MKACTCPSILSYWADYPLSHGWRERLVLDSKLGSEEHGQEITLGVVGYSGWVYEKENLDCFKNMPGLSETVNISWIAELINEININTSSLEFTIFSVPVINHSIFLPIYSSHPPPWWEDTSKLWMNSRGAGEDILEQKEAGDSFLELFKTISLYAPATFERALIQ